MKAKVIIHKKKQKGRNDSAFYFGKHIATVIKGNEKLFIESQGEMEMSFSDRGKTYSNKELLKQLQKRQMTDRDLRKYDDRVNMSNWFVIRNESESIFDISTTTYTNAIKSAKELLN